MMTDEWQQLGKDDDVGEHFNKMTKSQNNKSTQIKYTKQDKDQLDSSKLCETQIEGM